MEVSENNTANKDLVDTIAHHRKVSIIDAKDGITFNNFVFSNLLFAHERFTFQLTVLIYWNYSIYIEMHRFLYSTPLG